ncbi:MAG: hypothetical protein KDA42_19315, partial [Planctomycetales bacterium]|nr:hypothetical protein [Planctomycetales bacterium]
HRGSPLWDAGAVVYWFRLVRDDDGVHWTPYLADSEAGIGRQLTVADVDGDQQLDIVVGGMKGAHLLRHVRQTGVDRTAWLAAQPKQIAVAEKTPPARENKTPQASAKVAGCVEGELFEAAISAGTVRPQGMKPFPADHWSGESQLWWTGAGPGATLEVQFRLASASTGDLQLVLSKARDYGIVQLSLDGQPLGQPVDLYNPEVVTSGVLTFAGQKLAAGAHRLEVKITGKNDRAVPGYMFGLDYVRFQDADNKAIALKPINIVSAGIQPTDAEGRLLNLDFETGTLADWTAEGEAFADQPIEGDTVHPRRNDMKSEHQGDFWIGGYEKLQDAPTGTLTSKPFPVTHRWATFLFNGGEHNETRAEIVRADSQQVVYKTSGQNTENMRRRVVDLEKHRGAEIFIRLVDQHTGHWGHLNFDDFRFHAKQPSAPAAQDVPLAADEYPYSGLPAVEAARAMQVPDGFAVSVFAAEPDVRQPIAMAIDDRGRAWVAEAYEYPRRAPEGEGRDRILIFEDTDGDGRHDVRKVFAEGLNLVSGLEVGFGGVWVGAAPYLMFIPDANSDDVPDGPPQILLDGWGHHDTHETLNAFIWGPDGWLYGCHGVFTHSLVGKPGATKEQRTPLNAAIWRYHPLRHEFEVFAHGTSNPWGVDFNDHGQAFCTACVIPHLFHIVQGGRYHRQAGQHFNPYTYDDIKTIADHRHYLGATPHSGNNKSDEAGGGHAHAGAMIYLGGAWPPQYRDQIFMNNIHGQRLNMDILKPEGSGYVGSHGPDFLLTGDRASQILNLRYGPDGQAIMIDWYDMNACHHGRVEGHDRSNGRVYKISYGQPRYVNVNLKEMTDLQLAELALHKNDWYVRHARRILQERATRGDIATEAVDWLVHTASSHTEATRRLRAAWALHAVSKLSGAVTEALLTD